MPQIVFTGIMDAMFPEARKTLEQADPEVYQLVQQEKKRQWCGIPSSTAGPSALRCGYCDHLVLVKFVHGTTFQNLELH